MTTATKPQVSADLVESIRTIEARGPLALTDVLAVLHVEAADLDVQVEPSKDGPQPVKASEPQRDALGVVADLLAEYKWPTKRRSLTAAEQRVTIELVESVKAAKKLIDDADTALREVVLNHGDVVAEKTGKVNDKTPRDKKGHYLIGDEDGIAVPGLATKVWRKLTAQKYVLKVGDVNDLVKERKLTPSERKAVIKLVEQVDEDAVLALVSRKPHLAEVFAGIIRRTGGSVAMTLGRNTNAED